MEEKKFMAKAELSRLTFDSNNMKTELDGFGSQEVPIAEIEEEREKLFSQVEEMKEVLSKFKSTKVEFVSKEEKAKVNIENNWFSI